MKEEKSIKILLYLFCGTYLIRVVFSLILHFKEVMVFNLFEHDNTMFSGLVLALWTIWDVVPLLSMLVIHYKNFSSFQNEEILFTEHSVDDIRDSYKGQFLLHDDENSRDLLETSGVINLESSEDSEESEVNMHLNEGQSVISKKKKK
jgi:hypothetical protein